LIWNWDTIFWLEIGIPRRESEEINMHLPKSVILFFVALPLSAVGTKAQTFKYQSVGFVIPAAINSSGAIAGSFCCSYSFGDDVSEALNHGFSLKGTLFKIAEPGNSLNSFATGIAPNGDVVGGFCPGESGSCSNGVAIHGYLFRNSSNSTVQIDVPSMLATLAGGINQSGQIVGMGCNTTTCSLSYPSESQGFLLNQIGGSFTAINYPGALGTAATSINDAGDIVGNYIGCQSEDAESEFFQLPCTYVQLHGFLLRGGTYTNIDPPRSISTLVGGINNSGEIVGSYAEAVFKGHGFLFKSGVYTIVDFPGASSTGIGGVNDKGQIVGSAQINSRTENFIGAPQ
jgi:uncharacterized membrane protein